MIQRSRNIFILVCAVSAIAAAIATAREFEATPTDRASAVLRFIDLYYVDPVDISKLPQGDIPGMLRALDSHCRLIEPRQLPPDSGRVGIGVFCGVLEDRARVTGVVAGSQASELGLRPGDRIVEVDHQPLPNELSTEDALDRLRGPAGSVVHLSIAAEAQAPTLELDIERQRFPSETVMYPSVIRPGIGYLRVARLAQTTSKDLEGALDVLRAQGATSLLLDLRSNQGGLLSQVVAVVDLFVPHGRQVLATRGRVKSANADYTTTKRSKFEGPIVVLIDGGSASGAELIAGALQDLDRALVVGSHSTGVGLIQNQFRLPDDSKLILTVARSQLPSGRGIERGRGAATSGVQAEAGAGPKFKTAGGRTVYGDNGIEPDIKIEDGPRPGQQRADMIQKGLLSEFAAAYVTRHPDAKWTLETLGPEFQLSEAEWTDLRAKVAPVVTGDSTLAAQRSFILRQVRAEIATATLGRAERYRILAEGDAQLQAALDYVPRAVELLPKSK